MELIDILERLQKSKAKIEQLMTLLLKEKKRFIRGK
jgi:hypothetical protein